MNKSEETGNYSTGDYSTGHLSTGHRSTGNYSTGNRSTGNWSTGNWSTGDCSTGDYSIGNRSTGNYSTGNCSTGHLSTGNWSTGNRSTGNWSTGNRSTGNCSTGNWSTGDYSTGHFSTVDHSGFGAFNKPCTPEEWNSSEMPSFLYFDLVIWIYSRDMTNKQKENNPSHETTGGFLKVYNYKKAFRKAWKSAIPEDREKIFKLPNFDAEVFKQISGIDVNKKIKGERTNE